MFCNVGGKRMYLWRAVDDEGEVLDMAMRPYRDVWTATKFLADLMIGQPIFPERIVTDGLKSYAGAANRLKISHLHRRGRLRDNNRAENSHLPIRRMERKIQGFKSQASHSVPHHPRRPAGPYHGWLLSTGNGLARELREVANLVAALRLEEANSLSDRLSNLVDALFAQAMTFGGNAFADANRAVDHIMAYGRDWIDAPAPRRWDGSPVPVDLVTGAERTLNAAGIEPPGYLAWSDGQRVSP